MAGEHTGYVNGRRAYKCVYGGEVSWTADEIRTRREELGLTQRQLAGLIEASLRTITSWEAGDARPQGRFLKSLDRVLRAAEPLTASDVRTLDDAELWVRLRETLAELEQRYYRPRPEGRHAAATFADPPPHLRRSPYPEEGESNPLGTVQSRE